MMLAMSIVMVAVSVKLRLGDVACVYLREWLCYTAIRYVQCRIISVFQVAVLAKIVVYLLDTQTVITVQYAAAAAALAVSLDVRSFWLAHWLSSKQASATAYSPRRSKAPGSAEFQKPNTESVIVSYQVSAPQCTMSRARVYTVDASTILSDAAILQRVFSFLPGHWLYLGGVCHEWMHCYKQMPVCEVSTVDCFHGNKSVACTWRTTLASAVFQSPSRVRLAVASGLQWEDAHQRGLHGESSDKQRYIAGLHADVPSLLVAEELGLTVGAKTVIGAADSGHECVVNYLIQEQNCAIPHDAVDYAAQNGNVNMLKCLRQNGCVFTRATCTLAASAGRLPALQYILQCEEIEGGHELSKWVSYFGIKYAAGSGNIELVQWIQQKLRGRMFDDAMYAAACRGQTAMCQYLHSQQCPWEEEASIAAAHVGHVETLVWLQEHGRPYNDDNVLTTAAQGGSIAVMEYLLQHRVVPTPAKLTDMLNRAGAYDHLQAAQWLRRQGAEWPAKLMNLFRRCSWQGELLAWARAEGCTSRLSNDFDYDSDDDAIEIDEQDDIDTDNESGDDT
eukprot:2536-Heterococcus_DN1.PRE.4